MRGAYLEGGRFATVLDICDHMTTFEAGWKLVGQRFEALRDWAETKAVIGVSSLLCITFGMESGDVGDIAVNGKQRQSHFGNAAEKATILVEVAIVDVIIADMFFNSKDHGGITQQRALSLFKKPSGEIAPGKAVYEVVLKNKLQFDLVADHLASGLSFRQVVSVMHHTKARIGIRRLGCLSDTDVSNCARVLVACNLQVLRNLLALESNWAISLAVDASTHLEHSYFDRKLSKIWTVQLS
ncbi:hypothetical protein AXG93_3253s1130 [Marchantia polymorpha subsp. ruderalis]|uniref:Uncharacterized protein n=1 Tax=Marchantia polymorpha subsp. ruderalis TaxID=1480154 RepID=A0A176WPM2_MARPO|nr:hypothetical protein AXG93_3253s1130 [Marchantia polymorpha subsp. ruderalis]